jgi:hypothetical protein
MSEAKKIPEKIICGCGKEYKSKQGFAAHKKKCNTVKSEPVANSGVRQPVTIQVMRQPVVTQEAQRGPLVNQFVRDPVVPQPATREPVTDQVARDTETINEILANRERAEKREMMENYIRTAAVIRDQAINRDPVVANISNEIFMTLVKQNQELRNTIAQERMIFRRIMEYIEAYKRGENPTVPN